MGTARILHVDDEPDIREVVRISLGLDPQLTVRSCSSGAEALSAAGDWMPDLILLDVMMPDMDGPTTLSRLNQDPRTNGVQVVFMTARAQARELDYFKSLGARGVIAKPFDPISLAASVRDFLRPDEAKMETMQEEFLVRAQREAVDLAACREKLHSPEARQQARQLAHRLTGAGGIFGFVAISADAAALEDILIADGADAEVQRAIDTLVSRIKATHTVPPAPAPKGSSLAGLAAPTSTASH